MKTLTDEQIAEDEKLCEAATEGPWKHSAEHPLFIEAESKNGWELLFKNVEVGNGDWRNDCRFVARARTALPEYIAEVRRLREESKVMSKAILNWASQSLHESAEEAFPGAVYYYQQGFDDACRVAIDIVRGHKRGPE